MRVDGFVGVASNNTDIGFLDRTVGLEYFRGFLD